MAGDPFGVRPGRPAAAADDDDQGGDDRPPLHQLPDDEAAAAALEGVELVEPDTVAEILDAFWYGLHLTVGRGGPPDAFRPTREELDGMAAPATRVVNRSAKAAAVARHGDVLAFGVKSVAYGRREFQRVADYRAEEADADAAARPDDALAGEFGVSSAVRPRPMRTPGA